jgi:hypothetical protein
MKINTKTKTVSMPVKTKVLSSVELTPEEAKLVERILGRFSIHALAKHLNISLEGSEIGKLDRLLNKMYQDLSAIDDFLKHQ